MKHPNFKYLTCLLFGKSSMLANMIPKITTRHEVDNEIEIVTIFKGVVHINQESENIKNKFEFKQTKNKLQQAVKLDCFYLSEINEVRSYVRLTSSPKLNSNGIDYLRMVQLAEKLLFIHN